MGCEKCKKRKSCTKVCEKVNNLMLKDGIRRSSWIRKDSKRNGKRFYREIAISNLNEYDSEVYDKRVMRNEFI